MADITETGWELNPAEIHSGFDSDAFLAEPRSPGTHQSDVIRDLENIIIKPGQRRPDTERTDEDMATLNRYRELGMMWEIILEAAFKRRRVDGLDPKRFLRQVEIEQDEIFKTIDAIHIPDWRVLEYKLTFRSMGRASLDRIESEFWSWFTQLKGNCYGHGTRLASLFVFWVNGTYHPPIPMTKRYDIIFEERELIDNWGMITQHRDTMRREGRLK